MAQSVKNKIRVSFQIGSARVIAPAASLTVECALVLPLFFLGMVSLITAMSLTGCLVRESLELSGSARTAALAAGEVYASSGYDSGDIWIDLPHTVSYPMVVRPFPIPELKVTARARVYPWIGACPDFGRSRADSSEENSMVYVTENREVYHTHDDCTHLQLSVTCVPKEQVSSLRNADGSRYKPCSGFPKDYDGPVYLTSRGEYYYPSGDYPGLTRHIRMVKKSEAGDLPLCSRCQMRDAA